MHKLLIPAFLIALGAFSGCGSTEDGAIISPDVNSRNLCNYNVSVETEARCTQSSDCTGQAQHCWFSEESHFNTGLESCQSDGDCQAEGDWSCYNGWCHQNCTNTFDPCQDDEDCNDDGFGCNVNKCQKICTTGAECDAGDYCLSGYCHDCDRENFCTDGLCHAQKGFCRQCQDDGGCDVGMRCDHGWCHQPCTQDADCGTTQFCTGSFCRKPHVQGTEISFCNDGNKDLEVYLDEVTLHGADDACVFSRFEWSPPSGTVTLAPDDCSLYLNVKFTPKDVGEFRAFIKIPSNSIKHNPLLIFMCGQAVESVCNVSEDGDCPDCTSCLQEDFTDLITNEPTPDCSGYF